MEKDDQKEATALEEIKSELENTKAELAALKASPEEPRQSPRGQASNNNAESRQPAGREDPPLTAEAIAQSLLLLQQQQDKYRQRKTETKRNK